MFRLVLGVAVGYVLGAQAGRHRYEQIVKLGSKAAPAVKSAAGFGFAQVSKLIGKNKRSGETRPDDAYLVDVESQLPAPLPAS